MDASLENESVRHVVKLMIPGSIGVAAFQINVLFTQGLAFWVDPTIVASFNYAVRLMELPQGVFGLSLATYLLPTLSGLAVEKKHPEFRQTLREGLGHLLLINFLAAAMLCVLATPMLRLLFELGGAFDADSTARTAPALICLGPGLIAYSAVNILARAFYALNDIKTPMRISIFCLVLNLVLVAVLVWRFKQTGLALANSISAAFNAALLSYALSRKLKSFDFTPPLKHLFMLAAAATAAGFLAWSAYQVWEHSLGHQTVVRRLGAVFVPIGLATSLYLGLAFWFNLEATQQLGRLLRRRRATGG